MFLLIFVCWIIFNQALTFEIAAFGLVVSGAVYFFACKFMDYSVKKDIFIIKKIGLIVAYIGVLIVEIVKANLVLFEKFFIKKTLRTAVIVTFDTKLSTKTARMVLANSITLTPGTITTNLEGQTLTVHCVDRELAKGLNNTVFEQKLLKLEEGINK